MTSVGRCSALLLAFAVMVACASSPPARPAEAAPEIDPTNPLAGTLLMQQGRALVNEGKIPEGMAKYALALKLQPDNPTLHNLIGMAELQRGNAGKALESFNRALLLAPKYSDALSNRGAAYMQLGQYSLAESDFLSVLSDNTYANRSGVYYNLGSLNFVRGNLVAAEENLRRATRDAGPVEAYFLLGQVEEAGRSRACRDGLPGRNDPGPGAAGRDPGPGNAGGSPGTQRRRARPLPQGDRGGSRLARGAAGTGAAGVITWRSSTF
jgi:tetratricopeptide (TPR) repeat protein